MGGIVIPKPKIKMQGQTGKTLESAYEEFYTFKKINNLSKESLMFYGNSFRIFGLFHDTAQPCESVTKETVYKYIEHLQSKGTVNDVTINSYLRGIRVTLYYFMELGYMPKFNIKLIRCDKEIKETYTNEELEMLLKKPDVKKVGFAEYRNWVIVNYLLGTGNRLRTLVNLKWADVDFQNDLIRLTTVKNRKQQMIPLSSTLKTILKEYRVYRKGDTDDYVFCSQYGETRRSSICLTENERGQKLGMNTFLSIAVIIYILLTIGFFIWHFIYKPKNKEENQKPIQHIRATQKPKPKPTTPIIKQSKNSPANRKLETEKTEPKAREKFPELTKSRAFTQDDD